MNTLMNSYKYFLTIFINLSFISACTIGVTRDNHDNAILWKNRDLSEYLDSSEIHYTDFSDSDLINYAYITKSGGAFVYQGLNEKGFGIANSIIQADSDINSRLIPEDEHELIEAALSSCDSLDDFYALIETLESTQDDDDHIQSNFAVIDNYGGAAIYEIDTSTPTVRVAIETLGDSIAIYRSNHFKLLDNPSEYEELNLFNCFEDDIDNSDLVNNKMRYCASQVYIEEAGTLFNDTPIEYLIKSSSSINNNNGPMLRSLSRINFGEEDFYQLPYSQQITYDNGAGRPAGYILTSGSIARYKTTTSIVMKSNIKNLDNSYLLTTLGNPLLSPFIPIKIVDFDQINIPGIQNYFNSISSKSYQLRNYLFDYGRDPDYPTIKRWVDSQHLNPTDGDSWEAPNHDGIFHKMESLESTYIDFTNGDLISSLELELISIAASITAYYDDILERLSNDYDDPIYQIKIGWRELDVDDAGTDFFNYRARRFINYTFHYNFDHPMNWMIEETSNTSDPIPFLYEEDTLNPIIYQSNWDEIVSQFPTDIINIKMLDSSFNDIAEKNDLVMGCTNENYLNYSSATDIDNGTCICNVQSGYGDVNIDNCIDVLDVVQIVNYVLGNLEFSDSQISFTDVNDDGSVNIIDILIIIDYILEVGPCEPSSYIFQ